MASIDDIRQRTWDFSLTVITVLLLAALGVQSFVGTLVTWWSIRMIPAWEQSAGYTAYVAIMNQIAAPLIVALVVAMGLCVPKRLFSRRLLVWVSAAMVAVGVAAGVVTSSLSAGLTVYLLLSAAIQLGVVIMTVAGVRGPSYLTEGRLTKTGSGLLHLGFIVFTIVVVSLQASQAMAPVFWFSAVLVTVGTVLSFYANSIAWRRSSPREESAFDWDAEEGAEPEGEPTAEDPTAEDGSARDAVDAPDADEPPAE